MAKKIISITIDENVIKKVDALAHMINTNRSQLVEDILRVSGGDRKENLMIFDKIFDDIQHMKREIYKKYLESK